MNNFEEKMLQDRESHSIGAGIVFLFFALPLAFILAIFIAYPLGLHFTPVFYTVWAALELIGVCGIAGGIREKVERRKHLNS